VIALADEEQTHSQIKKPSFVQYIGAGIFTLLAIYVASVVPTAEIAWVSAILILSI